MPHSTAQPERVCVPDSAAQVADAALDLLARLPRFLDQAWCDLPGDQAGYFGDPGSTENGIRTNASLAFALAVWLKLPNGPGGTATVERREQQGRRCLALLRYLISGHVSAGGRCANGLRWGLDWQSSWWAAKLGLAALLMGIDLPPELDQAMGELVSLEANRHLSRNAPSGLFLDTKAEENAWDAEILAVAMALCPGHSHFQQWSAKLAEFSANVFSAPQDRHSPETLDGLPVRDIVYTCNIHADYSLENHGSYHFCYVASPLLSKAYVHAALRSQRIAPGQALQHHVGDVWALARHTFLTNRFAYLGGQDWARYTYGEYFIVPALSYLQQVVDDACIRSIQAARLAFLQAEARGNTDGSFYGHRFTANRYQGQFVKYEADTFACIALTCWLESLASTSARADEARQESRVCLPPKAEDHCHLSPEGQFVFWRGPDFFFSFAWSHLGRDVASLCLGPSRHDDLFEWHEGNGIGRIRAFGEGMTLGVRSLRREGPLVLAHGRLLTRDRRGRGLYETVLDVSFNRTTREVTVRCTATALRRLWLVHTVGLSLRVPNDVFNGGQRRLDARGKTRWVESMRESTAQSGPNATSASRWGLQWERLRRKLDLTLKGLGWRRDPLALDLGSDKVCMDGELLVESLNPGQHLTWRQFDHPASPWGSLWVDQLESSPQRLQWTVQAGQCVLDVQTRLAVLGT